MSSYDLPLSILDIQCCVVIDCVLLTVGLKAQGAQATEGYVADMSRNLWFCRADYSWPASGTHSASYPCHELKRGAGHRPVKVGEGQHSSPTGDETCDDPARLPCHDGVRPAPLLIARISQKKSQG